MARMEAEMNPQMEIQSLYGSIKRCIEAKSYDKISKAANRILQLDDKQVKAFQCKVVALMLLEKYDEVLQAIRKNPQFIQSVLFEKAYSEYRLNRIAEAFNTINSVDKHQQNDLRFVELSSQILYKMEEFEQSLQKYKFIMRESQEVGEDERSTNYMAILAALSLWQNNITTISQSELDAIEQNSFETMYNMACFLIGQRRYEEALSQLNRTEAECRAFLESDPDITEEEIFEEIAPILAQKAFVLSRLAAPMPLSSSSSSSPNKMEREANEINTLILRNRPDDAHALAVAANNVVCFNRDQNVFDSKKKLKIAFADALKHKLTMTQRAHINANVALFYLLNSNLESCRSVIGQFHQLISGGAAKQGAIQSSSCQSDVIQIEALLKLRQQQPRSAILEFIQQHCGASTPEGTESDDATVRNLLFLAQFLLGGATTSGDEQSLSKVCQVLELLPEPIRWSRGVLSTRVSLLLAEGKVRAALELLQLCLQQQAKRNDNQHKTEEEENEAEQREDELLRITAQFCLRHRMWRDAAQYYEQLLELEVGGGEEKQRGGAGGGTREELIANLVHAYSQFDTESAKKASSKLEDFALLSEREVDQLESAFIYGLKYIKKMAKGPSSGEPVSSSNITASSNKKGGEEETAAPTLNDALADKRKKKKRKPRLPKNLDAPIDPERWIPRRERRKGATGRRRDRKGGAGPTFRGPQGATKMDIDLDASRKPVSALNKEEGGASTASATATENQKPSAPSSAKYHQQKKSKKKNAGGKRW